MKNLVLKKLWTVGISLLMLGAGSTYLEAVWKPVGRYLSQRQSLTPPISPTVQYRTENPFIATAKHVWVLKEGVWTCFFKTNRSEEIRSFAVVSSEKVVVATATKLYHVTPERVCTLKKNATDDPILNVWVSETGSDIWLSTRQTLIHSIDGGVSWSEVYRTRGQHWVTAVQISGRRVFALASHGVLYSADYGQSWLVLDRFYVQVSEDEDLVEAAPETDDDTDYSFDIHSLKTGGLVWDEAYKRLWYVSSEGVKCFQLQADGWEAKSIPNGGLPDYEYIHDLYVGEQVWVASDQGVFGLKSGALFWKRKQEGLEQSAIYGIWSLGPAVVCLSSHGLYRWEASLDMKAWDQWSNEWDFAHEPSVQDVQQKAIWYAEVDKGKIDLLRDQAKKQALWPDVNFSFSRDHIDRFNVYSNGKIIDRPVEHDRKWGVAVSWDLGEFLYSSAQTSIDSRSKQMVQLRENVLDEVTRIYFERRREQMELALKSEISGQDKAFKLLRIDELTARLDAYTRGWFSKQLQLKT